MGHPLFPEIVVNGETIPSEAIAAEAQNHAAPAGKPGIAWRKAARALAIRSLLLQEAARRGVPAEPEDLGGGRFETEPEAAIRGLLETAVTVDPPSEETLRATYRADPGRFRSPPLWQASHILFAIDPADPASRDKARSAAEATLGILADRPDAFGEIAAEESACSSRNAGGQLGQLGPGDTVPEFEAAMAALAQGQIAPAPVETRFGFHVIRLDARAEGAVLPFEAVRDEIAAAAEKAAWTAGARALVDRLVAAADVTGIDLTKPIA